MYGRADLDQYKYGCSEMTNMYIKPQGPTIRRSGTQFIADMTTLFGEEITSYRLVDFVFDETQAYCIIFLKSDTKLQIYFASYDGDSDVYGLIDDGTGSPYYIEDTTWDLDPAKMDYAQSKDVLFIAYRYTPPLQLARNDHNDWAFSDITFTDGYPTDWADMPVGYPEHVTFYEQRLVYAGTYTYPQHLWFSETGDFYNILPASAPTGTDPFTVQIKSERHNQIQWLASTVRLGIGTLGDEWVMYGSSSEGFTAETVNATRHSSKGSEAIRPVLSGSTVLFVERLGRTVNEFVYDYDSNSYTAVDLSVLSSHMTDDYSITRWGHQKVPNSIIWCIRSDGEALALTYLREHSVTGWSKHDTEGYFRDVCCIPDDNTRETSTWFLVERVIEDVSYLYLERLTKEFTNQVADDAWMVDSALNYKEEGTYVTTLAGLEHLEGKTVSILTNGAVHPDRVVTDGAISLIYETDNVVVGLPYTSRLIPLPLEISLDDGTSIGRTARITNMSVYLHRSLGMWIGRLLDEMEEVPFRVPTDLIGQGVPLFSGIRKISFPEGYSNHPTLIIEQRQPLPMLVVSIMNELEVYS